MQYTALLPMGNIPLQWFETWRFMMWRPILRTHVHRAEPDACNVGDYATIERLFTPFDIILFAWISGDWNSVHWDRAFAIRSGFENVIAHGFFSGSPISALFGMTFPGVGTIYKSQTMEFKRPVYAFETVVAEARIVELFGSKRNVAKLACVWRVGDEVAIEGEAVLRLPDKKS